MQFTEEQKEAIQKYLNTTRELRLVIEKEYTKNTDRLKELEDILNNFRE